MALNLKHLANTYFTVSYVCGMINVMYIYVASVYICTEILYSLSVHAY